MRLSRRDRCALRLAYECVLHLSRHVRNDPFDGHPFRTTTPVERAARASLIEARQALDLGENVWRIRTAIGPGALRSCVPRSWRILRARLGLLLRALLRSEDWAIPHDHVHRCTARCGEDEETGIFEHDADDVRVWLRYRALWEIAPPHEVPR